MTVSNQIDNAVRRLAFRWAETNLSGGLVDYNIQLRIVTQLLAATNSIARTTVIVEAVLHQAIALDKPAEWVVEEMVFESYIASGYESRKQTMLDLLKHARCVNDQLLDQYNERLVRFNQHPV